MRNSRPQTKDSKAKVPPLSLLEVPQDVQIDNTQSMQRISGEGEPIQSLDSQREANSSNFASSSQTPVYLSSKQRSHQKSQQRQRNQMQRASSDVNSQAFPKKDSNDKTDMNFNNSDHGSDALKPKKAVTGSRAFTNTLGAIDKKRLKNLKVIASKRQRASNADIAEVAGGERTANSSLMNTQSCFSPVRLPPAYGGKDQPMTQRADSQLQSVSEVRKSQQEQDQDTDPLFKKNRLVIRKRINFGRQHLQSGGLDTTDDSVFSAPGQSRKNRELQRMGMTQRGYNMPQKYQKYMLSPINQNEFEVPSSAMPTEFPFSYNKPQTSQRTKFTSMIRTRGQKASMFSNIDLSKASGNTSTVGSRQLNEKTQTSFASPRQIGGVIDQFPFASQSVCEPVKRLRSEENSLRVTEKKSKNVKDIINDLLNQTTVNLTDDNSVSTLSPTVSPRGGVTSFSQYDKHTTAQSTNQTKQHAKNDQSKLDRIKNELMHKEYKAFAQINGKKFNDDDNVATIQNMGLVQALAEERKSFIEAIDQVSNKVLKRTNPEVFKFYRQTVSKLRENLFQTEKMIVRAQERLGDWFKDIKRKDREIEDLSLKAQATLTNEIALQRLIEQFFCLESEDDRQQKLMAADEFLKSAPLIELSDIDQKNTAEGLYSVNPTPYMQDVVQLSDQAVVPLTKDDDPDTRGFPFKIDFAEKWYNFLKRRLVKYQRDSGIQVMQAMQDDRKFYDMGVQVGEEAINNELLIKLKDYRDVNNRVTKELNIKKAECDRITEEIQKNQIVMKQNSETIIQCRMELSEKSSEIVFHKTKFDKIEAKYDTLTAQQAALKTEITDLKSKLKESFKTISEEKERQKYLLNKANTAMKQKQDFESMFEAKDEMINKIQSQKQVLTGDLVNANSKLRELSKAYEELEAAAGRAPSLSKIMMSKSPSAASTPARKESSTGVRRKTEVDGTKMKKKSLFKDPAVVDVPGSMKKDYSAELQDQSSSSEKEMVQEVSIDKNKPPVKLKPAPAPKGKKFVSKVKPKTYDSSDETPSPAKVKVNRVSVQEEDSPMLDDLKDYEQEQSILPASNKEQFEQLAQSNINKNNKEPSIVIEASEDTDSDQNKSSDPVDTLSEEKQIEKYKKLAKPHFSNSFNASVLSKESGSQTKEVKFNWPEGKKGKIKKRSVGIQVNLIQQNANRTPPTNIVTQKQQQQIQQSALSQDEVDPAALQAKYADKYASMFERQNFDSHESSNPTPQIRREANNSTETQFNLDMQQHASQFNLTPPKVNIRDVTRQLLSEMPSLETDQQKEYKNCETQTLQANFAQYMVDLLMRCEQMIESGQLTTDKIMIHFISPPACLVLPKPGPMSIDQVKTNLKCIGNTLMSLKPLQNELIITLASMFDLALIPSVPKSHHFDLGHNNKFRKRLQSDFSCSPMGSENNKKSPRNAQFQAHRTSSHSPPRQFEHSPGRSKQVVQLSKGVGGQYAKYTIRSRE